MKTINRLMKIINQAAQMTGKRFVVSHRLKTVKGKMRVCPDTHLSIHLVSGVEEGKWRELRPVHMLCVPEQWCERAVRRISKVTSQKKRNMGQKGNTNEGKWGRKMSMPQYAMVRQETNPNTRVQASTDSLWRDCWIWKGYLLTQSSNDWADPTKMDWKKKVVHH